MAHTVKIPRIKPTPRFGVQPTRRERDRKNEYRRHPKHKGQVRGD